MAKHPRENRLDLELDYERIEFSEEEIVHARGVTASLSVDPADALNLLEHLGILPGATWYYPKEESSKDG